MLRVVKVPVSLFCGRKRLHSSWAPAVADGSPAAALAGFRGGFGTCVAAGRVSRARCAERCAGARRRTSEAPMIDDLWYKNAVIYCLDVETYIDSNGDGIGDFAGLSRGSTTSPGIGVTCLWLQPFYPSPNRDNGYDIADYYGVHPKHGTLGEFVEFMNHAEQLGLRVIVDLVVNHTSTGTRGSSRRAGPRSPYRDWYVWSKTRPTDYATGMVFPGVQKTTWTWTTAAREVLLPPLLRVPARPEHGNPDVRAEIHADHGVLAAAGRLGLPHGRRPVPRSSGRAPACQHRKDYELLHEMRDFLQWRRRDAILLAEANVPPDESLRVLRRRGRRMQMMLNFPVNQRLFYALATGDTGRWSARCEETCTARPPTRSGCKFLRSHDELDLGRLTDDAAAARFDAFGPDRTCSCTAAASAGGSRRCSPTTGGGSSWRSASCSRCRARRCCSTATRSAWATTCACRSASARARRCSGPTRPHGGFTAGRPGAAGGRRSDLRLPTRQRRGAAPRPGVAAQLDGARSACARSAPRSAGATGRSSHRRAGRAGDALRVARTDADGAAQFRVEAAGRADRRRRGRRPVLVDLLTERTAAPASAACTRSSCTRSTTAGWCAGGIDQTAPRT